MIGLSDVALESGLAKTSEVEQACKGVGFAILIGEIPERKRISMNSFGRYKRQALALQEHAAANCKVSFFFLFKEGCELEAYMEMSIARTLTSWHACEWEFFHSIKVNMNRIGP